MRASKHILIVGGGLAGTFMAAETLHAGHRVTLYDLPDPKAASRVAAGLFNIVTGRMASLTWQARTFLAAIEAFLGRPEYAGLREHFHWMPIYRPYKSAEERAEWEKRSGDPEFDGLVRSHAAGRDMATVNNSLGGLEILPCGWADIPALLDGLKEILVREEGMVLREEGFVYADLDPETGLYGDAIYDEVVFAEGVGIVQNPWFKGVEIRPLKGQVIDLEAEMGELPYVLLRKAFIIPKGGRAYTAGSTYEHRYADAEPTAEGEALLRGNVAEAIQVPFTVKGIRAGIRPTTPNRRPVMGRHPRYPRLVILNGLGTKGLIQAPWCAKTLRDWLDHPDRPLPDDIALARFFRKEFVI